jgi:hypothetical protein
MCSALTLESWARNRRGTSIRGPQGQSVTPLTRQHRPGRRGCHGSFPGLRCSSRRHRGTESPFWGAPQRGGGDGRGEQDAGSGEGESAGCFAERGTCGDDVVDEDAVRALEAALRGERTGEVVRAGCSAELRLVSDPLRHAQPTTHAHPTRLQDELDRSVASPPHRARCCRDRDDQRRCCFRMVVESHAEGLVDGPAQRASRVDATVVLEAAEDSRDRLVVAGGAVDEQLADPTRSDCDTEMRRAVCAHGPVR